MASQTQTQTILVPTDFTQVSGYAIEHAVNFSKTLSKGITLIHIIKKSDEIEEANAKIQAQAGETFKKFGIKPDVLIREGSIFTTIGEASKELSAKLVVMGTHGIQGMQKITGSWALKVTITSGAPVIIVQESPKRNKIERLIFPVDFKKENKEKIGWACFLAEWFNSKILVFKSNQRDKGYVWGIVTNMMFTERFFKNKGVDYETFTAKEIRNFPEQTIEFAKKVDADIILIMTTRGINLTDYMFGASEQQIIANEAKIPVMCVNPRKAIVGDGFNATGN
jgi:nucleotide-binding universal stress UspA family protein